MSISQLAREIKESPTLALNEKARLLREKGEPVIHLGAGEPKSKVPLDAVLGSAAKLTSGDIRYTPTEGIPALIKAVIRYTEENYGKVVGPKNVLVSAGAKQAFYNLMMTIVNPQDEVILLAPYWVSYPEIVKMVYGIPVVVTPEDGRFEPTMEDITQVVGSYTRAIVVNSPNNPSGAVYSEEVKAAKGDPKSPFSSKELQTKFRELAGHILEPAAVEESIEIVGKLEALADIGKLATVLQRLR